MRAAGLVTLPYHNHIPTMGEWGWVLGVNSHKVHQREIKQKMVICDYSRIDTRFLNNAAVTAMVNFGKGILDEKQLEEIKVNRESKPVLHEYYQKGMWALY